VQRITELFLDVIGFCWRSPQLCQGDGALIAADVTPYDGNWFD